MKDENESDKTYLRIGQRAGNFSIPFVLADKANVERAYISALQSTLILTYMLDQVSGGRSSR
jgi:hypothetical protein